MNEWRFCVVDPQDAVLELCGGSMDKGNGYGGGLRGDGVSNGCGYGYGDGDGYGNDYGDGYGNDYGYGWGDGGSPAEWE